MGDIRKPIDGELINKDEKLRQLHLGVLINEKLNHLKALDVHLDNLKTVEIKRIELKKEALKKEIQELQNEMKKIPNIIEVKKEGK